MGCEKLLEGVVWVREWSDTIHPETLRFWTQRHGGGWFRWFSFPNRWFLASSRSFWGVYQLLNYQLRIKNATPTSKICGKTEHGVVVGDLSSNMVPTNPKLPTLQPPRKPPNDDFSPTAIGPLGSSAIGKVSGQNTIMAFTFFSEPGGVSFAGVKKYHTNQAASKNGRNQATKN